MSRLNELVKELCPNGVEYKKLGDIEELGLIKLGRGNVISKTDIRECPGNYPIYSSSATGNGEFGRYGKYMFDYSQISWSIDGGGRFFLRKDDKYSLTNVSGWLRVLDDKVINIDYLYYVLTNEWQNKTFDYTHKAHPSVIRDEYIVPLPPLKIQQEIVKILDKFTELQAELQAELELRLKQYEYYHDELLSFDNGLASKQASKQASRIRQLINQLCPNGVEFRKLKDVSVMQRGTSLTKSKAIIGDIPVISGGREPAFYCESPNRTGETITIAGSGAGAGYVQYWNIPIFANDCFTVKGNERADTKYLYYFLASIQGKINEAKKGGGVPHVHISDVENFCLPLPPIEVQREIVKILDEFSIMVSDISIGLPAEIKLRQQQYEYYRDE